jgi:hypothetical protein
MKIFCFVSIDDFPFYMRWENTGLTNLNHIMDTVTKNFLTFEKIKTLIKSTQNVTTSLFRLQHCKMSTILCL